MRKRTSILSLLSAQKQVWAKQLVAQKNSGQSSWWRKRTLVKTAVCTKCPEFFFADSSFDQSSFAPPAALTRVLLCHQLLGPWSLGRLQIPTLDVSYSTISYKRYKTFNAVSHNFCVPTKCNYKIYWVNFLFKFPSSSCLKWDHFKDS